MRKVIQSEKRSPHAGGGAWSVNGCVESATKRKRERRASGGDFRGCKRAPTWSCRSHSPGTRMCTGRCFSTERRRRKKDRSVWPRHRQTVSGETESSCTPHKSSSHFHRRYLEWLPPSHSSPTRKVSRIFYRQHKRDIWTDVGYYDINFLNQKEDIYTAPMLKWFGLRAFLYFLYKWLLFFVFFADVRISCVLFLHEPVCIIWQLLLAFVSGYVYYLFFPGCTYYGGFKQ